MTYDERLIKDAKTIGADAVQVKQAEWGGWYVAILGGRVSRIFETQGEARPVADEYVARVSG